jgi:hypothetical protein
VGAVLLIRRRRDEGAAVTLESPDLATPARETEDVRSRR